MANYTLDDQTFVKTVNELEATDAATAANLNAVVQDTLDNTGYVRRLVESLLLRNWRQCLILTGGANTDSYIAAGHDTSTGYWVVADDALNLWADRSGDSWNKEFTADPSEDPKFVDSDNAGGWVCVVYDSGSSKINIVHATDPTGTWTEIEPVSTNTGQPGGLAFGGGTWMFTQQETSAAVIYWSTNRTTWNRVVVDAAAVGISTPFYSATLSKWFVGADDGEIFMSDDAGLTWSQVHAFTAGHDIKDIAECVNGDLLAGGVGLTSENLYRSTDGGDSWGLSPATGLTNDLIRLIAHRDDWLLGLASKRLWLSDDNGANWDSVYFGTGESGEATDVKCIKSSGDRIFLGGDGPAGSSTEFAALTAPG